MDPAVEEEGTVGLSDDANDNEDNDNTGADTESSITTDPVKQEQATTDDDDTSSSTCSTKEGKTTVSLDRKNSVEFDLACPQVHVIPSRSELTVEEKDAMWYHRLEKQAMLQGALKTAVDLAPRDDIARGLEQLTYQGGRDSEVARARLYSCFMREQSRLLQHRNQSMSSLQKEEALARVSCTMTRRWREEATERGHSDAVAAASSYQREACQEETTNNSEGGMLRGIMAWLRQNQAR